jgi:hypothetical protein
MAATCARRAKRESDRINDTAERDTAAEPMPANNGDGGRDGKGRFKARNPGGPGNPFARQVAQLRSALIQRVTMEDMGVIADDLILKARNGNLAAIKLLFQYVIGKPTDAVNPDTIDIEEYKQIYQPQKEIWTTSRRRCTRRRRGS